MNNSDTSDIQYHGVARGNMDMSFSPADNFYMYANGGWKKENPLKPEYASFGMFDKIRDLSREQVKDLILGLGDNPQSKISGTNAQKVHDIYQMAMDMERRNREGAEPIRDIVERINNVSEESLTSLYSWLARSITSAFFSTGVGPDMGDSSMNIMYIGEIGLGLGDRDYYLEENETNTKIMEAYQKYIKRLVELIGYSPEEQQRVWDNVIEIETEIAKNKKTKEERRNPQLSYNMLSFEDLCRKFSAIDWKEYFHGLDIDSIEKANVSSMKFLTFINSYLPQLDLQKIKDYLVTGAVSSASGVLSDDFHDANFELYGKVMSGQEEPKPLWKRAMAIPEGMFGEVVGQLYMEKYFPEEHKNYMLTMVENLRKSLGKHISSLTWMSNPTKEKALEKLSSLKVKIGYPDKWKDYSEIHVDKALSFHENVLRASEWFTMDNYRRLGKPVDKDEWMMTPQTVNAYYMPSANEICFPAAILQPPYFDPTADDAMNYGAIGVVIGHEMTHGFDDQGRQFDKNGNLSNWWAENDVVEFNKLADKLVEQFDNVEVAPGVHANGRFTLGENIADQGGLRIALTAYLDSKDGKEETIIDGFNPTQRFYLSYATVWANNMRDEEVLSRNTTDPHSLPENRVNITLRNIAPFHEAFDIKEGDNMFLPEEKRVIIW